MLPHCIFLVINGLQGDGSLDIKQQTSSPAYPNDEVERRASSQSEGTSSHSSILHELDQSGGTIARTVC